VSAIAWTTSSLWTAAGWTMLHLVWVGALIGILAALMRRLMKSAGPETRYLVALACLIMFSASPVLIFARLLELESVPRVRVSRTLGVSPPGQTTFPNSGQPAKNRQALRYDELDRAVGMPARLRVETVVAYLPWFWLSGSLATLTWLTTGLVGVERFRRSSRLVQSGEIADRCAALARTFGIVRHVNVGICDRLAMPVLIGIVRPLILLPPTALGGWSALQLEMILLHELAHLRRWDNLVNLIQRLIEALLFFHPVAWWLSGWARLERELCCDRLVIERIDQPAAYAETLLSLAGSSHSGPRAALAMADRHVLTRIRRLLNQEERSMKLSMPEGFGLLVALAMGALLVLSSHAAPPSASSNPKEMMQQVAPAAVKNSNDKLAREALPQSAPASRNDTGTTNRPVSRVPPTNPRAISLIHRDARRLTIVQLPTTPDGVVTYKCRGGIKIVCNSHQLRTVSMEADEAVIKRTERHKDDQGAVGSNGETWIDDAHLPMKVHLKGDVIFCEFDDKKAVERAVRASALQYDFVTGRVNILSVKPESTALEANASNKDDIKVKPGEVPKRAPAHGVLPSPVTDDGPSFTPGLLASGHPIAVPEGNQRSTSFLARSVAPIQVTQLAQTIEGVVTLVCRGGIRIVSKSRRFGTVEMEADEAVIVRNLYRRKGETRSGPDGATWVEEDELPMRVQLKGNVILRQDQEKTASKGERRTLRARELDYNFVTDHVVALDAKLEVATSGHAMPLEIASPRIEQFHPMVRRPNGSLAPSEQFTIRTGR
jgi:beta-lactamase regulating signal transducer with metallopeptidase domain